MTLTARDRKIIASTPAAVPSGPPQEDARPSAAKGSQVWHVYADNGASCYTVAAANVQFGTVDNPAVWFYNENSDIVAMFPHAVNVIRSDSLEGRTS